MTAADDITRLADIMASAIKYAGTDGDIAVHKVEYWESELRTLAQQGKADGVAEPFARGWVHIYPEGSEGGTAGDWDFHDLKSCPEPPCPTCRPAIVVITDTTPPAHSPDAGVTDEMVRGLRKILKERWSFHIGAEAARDALTAAMKEKSRA